MKQIISILAIASVAAATSCNSAANQEKAVALKAQQYTIDSMKTEMAKKHVVDSMNEVANMRYTIPQNQNMIPVTNNTVAAATPVRHSSHRRTKTVYVHDGYANTNQSQPVYQQAAPVEERRKKGWSAKAKGTVIGAGAGAITGALVDKNKGAGALIGGLIGAGAGLGTGAIIDKKQGR